MEQAAHPPRYNQDTAYPLKVGSQSNDMSEDINETYRERVNAPGDHPSWYHRPERFTYVAGIRNIASSSPEGRPYPRRIGCSPNSHTAVRFNT